MVRKILLSIVVICMVISPAFAQYQQSIITVTSNEIPKEVLAVHREKYPSAFDTKWQIKTLDYVTADNDIYTVTFKMDGRLGHKAFYNNEKGFLAYVGWINSFDLPESIQMDATNYLQDDFIKHGQLIQLEEPYIFIYRLKVNNGGLLEYFYFDKYGNMIPKTNLAPQIFAFI